MKRHSTATVPHSGESAHVILVLDEDLASLFLEGELVLDRVKISRNRGSFGIALFSSTPEARCEGRDIWVWAWE